MPGIFQSIGDDDDRIQQYDRHRDLEPGHGDVRSCRASGDLRATKQKTKLLLHRNTPVKRSLRDFF